MPKIKTEKKTIQLAMLEVLIPKCISLCRRLTVEYHDDVQINFSFPESPTQDGVVPRAFSTRGPITFMTITHTADIHRDVMDNVLKMLKSVP